MEKNNSNPQGRREIKLADNIPGAEYANAMQIQFNKEEMQLMFMNLFANSGRVSAKIVTSPGHLKRIITALTGSMKQYEEKFGPVEQSAPLDSEIGFKG